jgi:hypothetical protein
MCASRDGRCGRFHRPANALLVHEVVAKAALGIDLNPFSGKAL